MILNKLTCLLAFAHIWSATHLVMVRCAVYETVMLSHPPIQVLEYHGFKNVRLLDYEIPKGTVQTVFDFQALAVDETCPTREIIVYLQYGGFPTANPQNSSFPPDFYLHRMSFIEKSFKTDNTTTPILVRVPLPGVWFAGAFIKGSRRKVKISQKGIGESCQYALISTILSTVRKDILDISFSQQPIDLNITQTNMMYRFFLPEYIQSYRITVTDCQLHQVNNSALIFKKCPLVLAANSSAMADLHANTHVVDCSNAKPEMCELTTLSPFTNDWGYLQISLSNETGNITNITRISLSLSFNIMQECRIPSHNTHNVPSVITLYNAAPSHVVYFNQSPNGSTNNSTHIHHCIMSPVLSRMSAVKKDFTVDFHYSYRPYNEIRVPDMDYVVTSFEIIPLVDSGGTLTIHFHVLHELQDNNNNQVTELLMCLRKNSLPSGHSWRLSDECDPGLLLSVNSSSKAANHAMQYIPYPEVGVWYITFQSRCYGNSTTDSLDEEPCAETPAAIFNVGLRRCVDDSCGRFGNCKEYIYGVKVFSTCDCIAGYRGYGCTDDSAAVSMSLELASVMLLTMSNLLFVPAIILSIKRHFFIEALVYFYTMFFSTFYHACDTSAIYKLCIMDYNVLSYCDFYGSIMSFWFTLLVMARIPERLRWWLHVLGGLCLAMGVEYDRHGLWVFATPGLLGFIVMVISWVVQGVKRHHCFPPWRRYAFFLLPGVICAGTGLIIFAFVETSDNYKYTHSAWHMTIALSIVFLLPPRRDDNKGRITTCMNGAVPSMHQPIDDNDDSADPVMLENCVQNK